MTEKLTPEMLKDNTPWLACDGEAIVELEAYAAAWEAELARLLEMLEKQRAVVEAHDHLLDCKRAWLWSLQEKGLSVIEAGAEMVFCVVESKRAALEQAEEQP